MTAEQVRLDATREKKIPWKQWGPYLSERQWGTVREDYSESPASFEWNGDDLQGRGLYLDMAPWQAAAFALVTHD